MSRRAHLALVAAWVAAVATAAFALLWRLGAAGWATDEPVYRNAARAMFEYGNFSHNLEHPFVGKYLIGISWAALGDAAWASRLPSALATLACGALLALLARRIMVTRGPAVAHWSALATFVTWTLLPHPDPTFDIARVGYLDAPMACFLAAALYAAWRWQLSWSWRWALVAGAAAGLAVATKLPAAFPIVLLPVLAARRGDAPLRRRLGQCVGLVAVAGAVALATWLPLLGDLPRALRFLAAMQTRDVSQSIEVAGRTYTDGAPLWTQAWWQWDAWPAFAIVQLVALVVAWWALPRRAALFLVGAVLVPFAAYAVGGGRLLPHWQATWQVALAVLVGCSVVWLLACARASAQVIGVLGAGVVLCFAGGRVLEVARTEQAPIQALAGVLEQADVPGGVVIDAADVGVDRALVKAHPAGWDGTYHSAAERQHPWSTRSGGRPDEPDASELDRRSWSADEVTAVVAPRGATGEGLPIARAELDARYERREIGGVVVWIRRDRA